MGGALEHHPYFMPIYLLVSQKVFIFAVNSKIIIYEKGFILVRYSIDAFFLQR